MSVLRNPKFRLVVVIICIAIIIYESYCLYRDNKQYHIADSEYSNLADDTITMGDSDDLPEGATYPPLYIDYNQLKSIMMIMLAGCISPILASTIPLFTKPR